MIKKRMKQVKKEQIMIKPDELSRSEKNFQSSLLSFSAQCLDPLLKSKVVGISGINQLVAENALL